MRSPLKTMRIILTAHTDYVIANTTFKSKFSPNIPLSLQSCNAYVSTCELKFNTLVREAKGSSGCSD